MSDLIDRQEVLDILKEKWNSFSCADDAMQESIDTIEDMPSVTPTQDCISRQAVLDLADKGILVGNHNYKSVCNAINDLPSVTPTETQMIDKSNFSQEQYRMDLQSAYDCGVASTERTGHWITLDYQKGKFECSECHTQGYVDTCMYKPIWEFCPRCGADMRGDTE